MRKTNPDQRKREGSGEADEADERTSWRAGEPVGISRREPESGRCSDIIASDWWASLGAGPGQGHPEGPPSGGAQASPSRSKCVLALGASLLAPLPV